MASPGRIRTLTRRAVLIALLTGLLPACGSATVAPQAPITGQPIVTVPAGMPVVIAVAGRFDGQIQGFLDEQIAAFESANPDILVELIQLRAEAAGRHDELVTRLQAHDSSLDVLVLDLPWVTEFAAAAWLVPLQSYTSTLRVVPSELLTPTAQATTVGGQWVALPWTANGGVLYYRRDLLDKYGYALVDSSGNARPVTWADVQRIAVDVKDREGLPYGFVWQGAANETLTCNTLEFVWAAGGSMVDAQGQPGVDTPEVRAGLQQMADMVGSGASPAAVTSFTEDESLAAFRAGGAVLMRNWVYAWERLNAEGSPVAGKVGVARLPVSCLGGQALGLSPYSLQKQAAVRFMAFLLSTKTQAAAVRQAGLAPVRSELYRDPSLAGAGPWNVLYQALSTARPRPLLVPYSQVSSAIFEEVHRLLLGQQDVAATAAAMQRRIGAALQGP